MLTKHDNVKNDTYMKNIYRLIISQDKQKILRETIRSLKSPKLKK